MMITDKVKNIILLGLAWCLHVETLLNYLALVDNVVTSTFTRFLC